MKVWTWASLAPNRSWVKGLAATAPGSSFEARVGTSPLGMTRARKPKPTTTAHSTVRASTTRRIGSSDRGWL